MKLKWDEIGERLYETGGDDVTGGCRCRRLEDTEEREDV